MITTAIVCHNHGKFLEEAIESVLGQLRYPPSMEKEPTELILVDDASTDNSLSIMNKYATRNKFIHVIGNYKKVGHIHGYRQAIEAATQKYFHLMAADDVLANYYFYNLAIPYLEENADVGFVAGGLKWMDEKGVPLGVEIHPPFLNVASSREWLEAMRNFGNFVCGGAVIIRTEIQKKLPYEYDLPYSADWMNWAKALTMCKKAASIPHPVYFYRRHGGQMTAKNITPPAEVAQTYEFIDEALRIL